MSSKAKPIYKRAGFWASVGSGLAGGAAFIGYAVAGDWSAAFKVAASALAAAAGAQ